jgi:hypothetical protein
MRLYEAFLFSYVLRISEVSFRRFYKDGFVFVTYCEKKI